MNYRLGSWSRVLAPGYGWCGRCKTPWRFVQGHPTPYESRPIDLQAPDGTILPDAALFEKSCFPLCQKCWVDLGDPWERLPFYYDLWQDLWGAPEDSPWGPIRDAVLAGR